MAIITGILPDDLGSPNREPLQPRSSSPILPMKKRIRRKHSFVLQPDSSEEYSSPHASIYEAVYISATNSDSSGNRVELIEIPPRRSGFTYKATQNDENKKTPDVPAISLIDQIEFRYGWGTPLETITEKRSFSTIRTLGRTKSADDLPDSSLLGHRESFTLAKNPRRKASFSFDDLILVQKSYHEACATIARQSFGFPIDEVYAEPKSPIREPPERRPTPDGMPSWTASQNILSRVPTRPVQNAFQRFFGLPASGVDLSSRVPQPSAGPDYRSVSGSIRGRVAPRFRPPRSAYSNIDQHPFANAPMAQIKTDSLPNPAQHSNPDPFSNMPSAIARPARAKTRRKLQRVRFTPSATARDSEMLNLQVAIESTSSLAIHPFSTPIPAQTSLVGTQPFVGRCPHRQHKRPDGIAINANQHSAADPAGLTLPAVGDRRGAMSGNYHPMLTVPSSSRTLRRPSSRAENSSLSLVTDDPDPRSRVSSYSSTTWLMSGGLRSPSGSTATVQQGMIIPTPLRKTRESFCWRCACGRAGEKMLHWWKSSADCLCFVCCGFDLDEDVTVYENRLSPGYSSYRPSSNFSSSPDYSTARSSALDQHPRWTL